MTEVGEVIHARDGRRFVVVDRAPMYWINEKGEERVLSYALKVKPVNEGDQHGSAAIQHR